MIIEEYKLAQMLAYEAFIRRAAEVNMPFMLKGSFVTRQYFENPLDRLPADLDWVYMNNIADVETASEIFNEWATAVTEYTMHDGVVFTSFKKDAFWRMIDYAMADDFPTVNTDLSCTVDGKEFRPLQLDISFNLPMDNEPAAELLYRPLRGQSFIVPCSVALYLQVSWKLHQTLVRPRFKDLFDLIYLVQHPAFNNNTLQETMQALADECAVDNVDMSRMVFLLFGDMGKLFKRDGIHATWDYWRNGYGGTHSYNYPFVEKAEHITNADLLPTDLNVFERQVADALTKAGFTPQLVNEFSRSKPWAWKPETEQQPQAGTQPAKPVRFIDFIRGLFR
jgi:hypothetical protein